MILANVLQTISRQTGFPIESPAWKQSNGPKSESDKGKRWMNACGGDRCRTEQISKSRAEQSKSHWRTTVGIEQKEKKKFVSSVVEGHFDQLWFPVHKQDVFWMVKCRDNIHRMWCYPPLPNGLLTHWRLTDLVGSQSFSGWIAWFVFPLKTWSLAPNHSTGVALVEFD